jgi:hypothetical protein
MQNVSSFRTSSERSCQQAASDHLSEELLRARQSFDSYSERQWHCGRLSKQCAQYLEICYKHACKAGQHKLSTALVQIEESDETPFKKILCANRGEIAVRVFRAGTELGLRTVNDHCPNAFRLSSATLPQHETSIPIECLCVSYENAQAPYSSCCSPTAESFTCCPCIARSVCCQRCH